MRAMRGSAVTVIFQMPPNIFVNWPNVLARFMSRSITSRRQNGVVLLQPFCKSVRVSFVCFTSSRFFPKPLIAPESHRNEPRHVKGSACRRNRRDQPEHPAVWNKRSRSRIPQNLVFRPEAAERNDAADGEPARQKSPVGVRHVFAQPAHAPHVLLVVHAVYY